MQKNSPWIKIEPSILAGDFGHLADEAQRIEQSGADAIHIDIMDGHFVPNLSMGPAITAAIKRSTDLFLDVHLMIYNPFEYIERFVQAGANRITFHFEATEDVEDTLAYIRKCNCEAGLAFNPETTETLVTPFLDQVDLILLMTVHPGFGGQEFMPEVLKKIEFVRSVCDKLDIRQGGKVPGNTAEKQRLGPLPIQVDGGIGVETAGQCAAAGATNFVAGTALFKQLDMKQAVADLRRVVIESE